MRRDVPALLLALAGLGAPATSSLQSAKTEAVWQRELDERAVLLDAKESRIGRQVADVELTYLDGTKSRLAENLGPQGLVVFVRGAECPISKRYGSETARIEDEFRPRGFGFLFVDMEDPSLPEATREEIGTFGFEGRYALDPEQKLGAELGATRTSEAFLLDAARTLVYRGAIDDQYGRGVTLAEPRTSFLRDALEARLAGEVVRVEATMAPGCVLAPRASAPETAVAPGQPTYHREVSRILQRNCIECHRKGGGGPFALDQLEAVRRKSATIRTVLEEGSMPPWFASPDCGPFLKERRVSAEERETVLAWLAAGAPAGDPADAPEPRRFKEGWQIGEPDVIVSMPESFQVPAEGIVDIQRFETVEPTTEDMWVARIQILPEALQVVHHIGVSILLPGQREDRFYGYQPGGNPLVYEDGVALFVPKGARFAFAVHYTPNGVAASDRTRMGFVRAKRPPEFAAVSRSQGKDLFIPAGASHVSFTDSFVLPYPVLLRSLTPHMHLRGKGFRFEAFLPDGTQQLLLQLDSWDSDWQCSYEFREWRPLPKGTRLDITAWYDNSAANPDNPDPTADVRNGPQTTTDEMMFYAIEWVMPNRKP
jgi:mono/diheme cytochrome c family protein